MAGSLLTSFLPLIQKIANNLIFSYTQETEEEVEKMNNESNSFSPEFPVSSSDAVGGVEPELAYEKLQERYFDPESLTPEVLELFLREGEIRNIHPIEDFIQPVSPHADRALLGHMSAHKDMVLEAELILPDQEKPLLVVYKPDSGIDKGSFRQDRVMWLPSSSSSYSKKDEAAWRVISELDLSYLAVPTVYREDLPEGPGSVRSYIWGKPGDLLSLEAQDAIFGNQELMENVAFIDYILQTMDRRDANMIWTKAPQNALKLIDHSLTFFDEYFAQQFTVKGPRLMVAYDNQQEPMTLRRRLLPERLRSRLNIFLQRQDFVVNQLVENGLLTDEEINDLFRRSRKIQTEGTFL
jgi:hypothetical protein